jgi:large subunit ribosomal protein L2
MAIRLLNPTTPGQRGMTTQDFSSITTKKPVRSLVVTKRRDNGRNNQGRITVRHHGGGARRFYRLVDFNLPTGLKAKIEQIEYDPNRSARIARLKDESGTYYYILAAANMKVGQTVICNAETPIDTGNRLQLKNIPLGSMIHSVELNPGHGGQLARSAGNSAQLVAKEENNAQIRLPSGEVRLVAITCMASLGAVGNEQHQNVKIGKAGRNRNKGIRPSVRGVVMNAADHPHGGGDGGKHGIGGGKNHGSSPKTPWGQKTLGYKTRRRKSTNKYIVKSRHSAKRS